MENEKEMKLDTKNQEQEAKKEKKDKKKGGRSLAGPAALVLLLALLGAGLGFGPGGFTGKEDGSEVSKNQTVPGTTANAETTPPQQTTPGDTTSAQGGEEKLSVAVSVVESSYFYQNQKIELEELLAQLKKLEGEYIVEITDDNASLNAYNKLVETLKENNILYTEK